MIAGKERIRGPVDHIFADLRVPVLFQHLTDDSSGILACENHFKRMKWLPAQGK
jgi:hypothetical protein